MGASQNQIAVMLFRNIARLVLIGGVIASILSWWVVGEWLKVFTTTKHQPFVFFVATACMAFIAFLTHLIQLVRITASDLCMAA